MPNRMNPMPSAESTVGEKLDLIACQKVCQKLYKYKLFDLGEITGDSRMRGICSPVYDESVVSKYVHAEFLEGASTYYEKYQNVAHFRALLSTALQRISVRSTRGLRILDLGSGAGNTVIPLLELCPDSFVIASDLSKELLAMLKRAVSERGLVRSCALLQLNAEELDFQPSSFDLVVGASILHHLLSPDRTIEGCARVLKKGGHAIFFEPFEIGIMILRLVYNAILDDPRSRALPVDVTNFLRGMIRDWDVRKGRDKSSPLYLQVDDKWLFTRKYFQELAERYGFSRCTIYPLHPTERQFENHALNDLRLVTGRGREALPEWALRMIQQCDLCFSDEVRSDLLISGCIILEKKSARWKSMSRNQSLFS
jgi:ubiquinone/menaquinone biosynthesis C-methylase UbiE